jgi:hypothetical protein
MPTRWLRYGATGSRQLDAERQRVFGLAFALEQMHRTEDLAVACEWTSAD